jgi:hypothetical protein
MNNPDHISESLETIFWVKILKFFDADPGPGSFRPWILDPGWENSDPGYKHPESATLYIISDHRETNRVPVSMSKTYKILNTTKLILLDSLLQEVEATLPHLVFQKD